ncbi:MAG: penicillin-binding protein 2 [Patescibacteria group bacterium]
MQSVEEKRVKLFGIFLLVLGVLVIGRSFHLQIVKGGFYQEEALSAQSRLLQINPQRGEIYALNDDDRVPLVLNEQRWEVFSDPKFVESATEIIELLDRTGVPRKDDLKERLTSDTRYVKIAVIDGDVKDSIEGADVAGLYFKQTPTRVYPEGNLASHVLGFINSDEKGQYGIEQHYAEELSGSPGRLKAITDAEGVPLAFEQRQIEEAPENGQDIVLTIDAPLQRSAQEILDYHANLRSAESASLVILDADTGAVKAMANYPDFEPGNFSATENISDFTNTAVSSTVEPGSVMKTLVLASALSEGVVGPESTYYDPGFYTLNEATIRNAREYGAGTQSMVDIIARSLNTGSSYLLSQLGGGFNEQSRVLLHKYYTENFGLGVKTGIDLPNESPGQVQSPTDGFGLDIRYANMTFGQGLTVTTIQLAAAYAVLFNDTGNYYQPYVVQQIGDEVASPIVKKEAVFDRQTHTELREVMKQVGDAVYPNIQRAGLEISGKTGTGEIADGFGGYSETDFTGSFVGYVKSDSKTLIVSIRLDKPRISFAGSRAAAFVWRDIVDSAVSLGKVL